jgi:hypothetical protein
MRFGTHDIKSIVWYIYHRWLPVGGGPDGSIALHAGHTLNRLNTGGLEVNIDLSRYPGY